MYTLDNNTLTPENLHLFYSTLDYLGAIPYNGVKITDTEIIWSWEYSGGWGLGYDGSLKYNIASKTYYLQCYQDSTKFEDFNEIKKNYNIEWMDDTEICVSTTDINKVVDAGFYYSFDFTECFNGTNVVSSKESIEHAKTLIA